MLYDFNNRPIVNEDRDAQIRAQIAETQAALAALKAPANKSHRAQKPKNQVWVRLGELKTFGKVPQQQKDLAAILVQKMEVGVQYSEEEVFNFTTECAANYPSLVKSTMHCTYLLRYYRGLKHEGNHAGFIARGFLRVQ